MRRGRSWKHCVTPGAWMERHEAFNVFIDLFLPIVSCLEAIANTSSSEWNRDSRNDAASLLLLTFQPHNYYTLVDHLLSEHAARFDAGSSKRVVQFMYLLPSSISSRESESPVNRQSFLNLWNFMKMTCPVPSLSSPNWICGSASGEMNLSLLARWTHKQNRWIVQTRNFIPTSTY